MNNPADADASAHVFVAALADRCVVDGADGHHLQRVRRLVPGERVTAADDSGAWRVYEIVEAGNGRLVLDARGDADSEIAPSVGVALAVALTKGGLDAVVTHVTELGVSRIVPVQTARAVVRWDAAKAVRSVAKLRAVAREAAMQCRRASLPEIEELTGVAEIADRPGLLVADRGGARASSLDPPGSGEWTVLVGPEGGLDGDEHELLAGTPRLALAQHVLRAATAPVVAVAILRDRIA